MKINIYFNNSETNPASRYFHPMLWAVREIQPPTAVYFKNSGNAPREPDIFILRNGRSRKRPSMRVYYVIAAGIATLAAFLFLSCKDSGIEDEEYIRVREQFDDVEVISLPADRFNGLTPEEKQLAYHISMAAISGTPITFTQIHPDGYRVKLITDGIISHTVGMEERLSAGCEHYAKYLWLNKGFYDIITGEKFIPRYINRQRMQYATMIALSNGARIGFKAHKVIQFTFDELDSVIFNLDFEPEASGVRQREWADDYKSGNIRAGNDTLSPGAASQELIRITDQFRQAMPFAGSDGREMLVNFTKHLETGEDKFYDLYLDDWSEYTGNIDWMMELVTNEWYGGYNKFLYGGLVIITDEKASANAEEAFELAKMKYAGGVKAPVISAGQALTAAGVWEYNIPEVVVYLHYNSDNPQVKILVASNVIDAAAVESGISSGEYLEQLFNLILQDDIWKSSSDKISFFTLTGHEPGLVYITPVPTQVKTKMGKVTNVVLDYPVSLADYGIKNSELSKVIPPNKYEHTLKQ